MGKPAMIYTSLLAVTKLLYFIVQHIFAVYNIKTAFIRHPHGSNDPAHKTNGTNK